MRNVVAKGCAKRISLDQTFLTKGAHYRGAVLVFLLLLLLLIFLLLVLLLLVFLFLCLCLLLVVFILVLVVLLLLLLCLALRVLVLQEGCTGATERECFTTADGTSVRPLQCTRK